MITWIDTWRHDLLAWHDSAGLVWIHLNYLSIGPRFLCKEWDCRREILQKESCLFKRRSYKRWKYAFKILFQLVWYTLSTLASGATQNPGNIQNIEVTKISTVLTVSRIQRISPPHPFAWRFKSCQQRRTFWGTFVMALTRFDFLIFHKPFNNTACERQAHAKLHFACTCTGSNSLFLEPNHSVC